MEDGSDVEDEGRGVDVADVGRRRAGSAACGRQPSDGVQSAAIAQLETGRDRHA